MSEWNHYLDLETGKVVGIDDETRRMLDDLIEETYGDEGDNQLVTLEELLQGREDIQDWQKELLLEADRVDREYGHRYVSDEPDDPYQGYNDMDHFIATLDDDDLQDRLWRAIRGRGAFRRFKDPFCPSLGCRGAVVGVQGRTGQRAPLALAGCPRH